MCFIVKGPACFLCVDVERYSDKYHSGEHTDTITHWSTGRVRTHTHTRARVTVAKVLLSCDGLTDWKRLPKELRTSLKRRPGACEDLSYWEPEPPPRHMTVDLTLVPVPAATRVPSPQKKKKKPAKEKEEVLLKLEVKHFPLNEKRETLLQWQGYHGNSKP